ncbi:MAG: rRNA pseudouridine synthase [Zoogloeaceae bacterium]|jgi:16S rRNA pseudouridine516 synthase|nr:rRNA pseudouridine synthase [Zoogloeaceae bacterium]
MQVERFLQSQGFGTRRACRLLARAGRVSVNGLPLDDPEREIALKEGEFFTVDGATWPYYERALILLNKPAGYECSNTPRHHPGVHTLLPPQFLARGLQCVGRLDVETTGLLLLTDDGNLQHRLISPKAGVRKCYRMTLDRPLEESARQKLLAGVTLRDDPAPAVALSLIADKNNPCVYCMTLAEGRYHQARRMAAAVGCHVEALCRVAIGGLTLPPDLPEGGWRWLGEAERATLFD